MHNHKKHILYELESLATLEVSEEQAKKQLISFINSEPNCFSRSNLTGHVTASSWVLSANLQNFLLLRHKKLNIWCHPGGHCDGNPDALAVSRKELSEEAGLNNLPLLIPTIFAVAVYEIPQYQDVPQHKHFDITYLFVNANQQPLVANEESTGIAWFANNQQHTSIDQTTKYLQRKANWYLQKSKLSF